MIDGLWIPLAADAQVGEGDCGHWSRFRGFLFVRILLVSSIIISHTWGGVSLFFVLFDSSCD